MSTRPASRAFALSTRDLLTLAALAALGGVASVYVQTLGTALRAVSGSVGGAQFLAGIHVVWLVLAVGLTRRVGAATVCGLLKGIVEFLSGNPHGVLVILISFAAGLLVDLSYVALRRLSLNAALVVGGALGASVNVFVFQLFAAIPTDTLAFGAMLLAGAVAMVSGAVFAGLLGIALLRSLVRAGVVRDQPPPALPRLYAPLLLGGAAVLAIAAGAFLYLALKGPPEIAVGGAVASAYRYSQPSSDRDGLAIVEVVEREKPGLTGTYRGVRLRDILGRAAPRAEGSAVLVKATDGYDFFITRAEVESNDNLILAQVSGPKGDSYAIAGAENSKAWVRNVASLDLVARPIVEMGGALQRAYPFVPDEWQKQMDYATLDLGFGARKYQGVPLGVVLERMSPTPGAATVVVRGADGEVTLSLAEALARDDLRLYAYSTDGGLAVALAESGGKVLVKPLRRIEVR